MIKNYNNDTSSEKLWNAIDKIDDKYIEEAIMYDGRKKRRSGKIFMKGITAVAATAMILIVSGIYYDYQNSGSSHDKRDNFNQVSGDNKDKISDVISKSNLVVSVMAAENDKVFLEEGAEVQVSSIKYSQLMSSVPAMPFTFDYDVESDENVIIRVSTKNDGNLLRYEISDEGIWSVKESGESLECKPGETLYWNRITDDYSERDSYGEIYVDVYEGESCIESKSINIYIDKENYTMSFE